MGCWNGTCMISNLPIIVGERVKLVLLKPSYSFRELKQTGGYVYSNDVYSPAFLPISGTYDDYGGIENIDKDWNYILVQGLLKGILGDKIIIDDETKTDYTIEDIFYGIKRNNLKYFGVDPEDIEKKKMAEKACGVYDGHGYSSSKVEDEWKELLNIDITPSERLYNMSTVMIREDVWDHIVENYIGEFWNHDDDEIKNGKYYITAKEWTRHKFDTSFQEKKVKGITFHFNNLFYGREGGMRIINPEIHNELLKKSNSDLRELIYKSWSGLTIINSFLSGTRKGWMVQPGTGSQWSGWDEHKLLAEKIIEICDENLKEYEDE